MSLEPKPKDLPEAQIVRAAELVDYSEGAVVSRVFVKKGTGTITLLAVDEGKLRHDKVTPRKFKLIPQATTSTSNGPMTDKFLRPFSPCTHRCGNFSRK